MTGLALVRRTRGDYPEAETLFQEALADLRGARRRRQGSARTLDRLAMHFVARRRRRPGTAALRAQPRRCSGGSVTRTASRSGSTASPSPVPPAPSSRRGRRSTRASTSCAQLGDRRNVRARCSGAPPDINADLGDAETAAAQFEESLTLFVEFGDRWFCGLVLESAAFLAAAVGDAERAVRLLGAADAVWAAIERPAAGAASRTSRPACSPTARSRLGEARFAAAWDEGRRLPLGATVELVAAVSTRDRASMRRTA